MQCFKYTIEGRVQGVGFRWSAKSFADKIGFSGYVINLDGGCVEILACGDNYQLEQLDNWLDSRRPMFAKITKLTKESIDLEEYPINFEIKI